MSTHTPPQHNDTQQEQSDHRDKRRKDKREKNNSQQQNTQQPHEQPVALTPIHRKDSDTTTGTLRNSRKEGERRQSLDRKAKAKEDKLAGSAYDSEGSVSAHQPRKRTEAVSIPDSPYHSSGGSHDDRDELPEESGDKETLNSRSPDIPSSVERLAQLRREEEKLRAQKENMRKEKSQLKKQKEEYARHMKREKRESKRLEVRDFSYPDSGRDSDDPSDEEKSDDREIGEQERATDFGKAKDEEDLITAKYKLKAEKEKLKRQEEQLRKERELLERIAKEDIKRIKREKEDLWRKAKEDMKTESKRPRRTSYDHEPPGEDMMSGWVKMRGPLKNWHLRWIVLKPGKLIYYRDMLVSFHVAHNEPPKAKDYQGIINLSGCKVVERHTKKGGYCFKIFHPREANIYATRGLKGEVLRSALVPLSADHAILRVPEEIDRTKWISAIELAINQKEEKNDSSEPSDSIFSPDEMSPNSMRTARNEGNREETPSEVILGQQNIEKSSKKVVHSEAS